MAFKLPLPKLPAAKPLTYEILQNADFSDIPTVHKIFNDLETRLATVGQEGGPTMLEWLDLYDQFEDALGEEWATREIEHYSDTENTRFKKAYLSIVNKIGPVYEVRSFELMQKLQKTPAFKTLPPYYDSLREGIDNAVLYFRKKNIRHQKRDTNLAIPYDQVLGALTVEVDGEDLTLQQIKPILEGADRAKRQEVWEKEKKARLAHHDEFNEIFRKQIHLRQQMAKNGDCILPHMDGTPVYGDYLTFGYKERGRNSTHEETLELHQAIEDHIMPYLRELQRDRLNKLIACGQIPKGGTLRPWDLTVDPDGAPPLKPFADYHEFVVKMIEVAKALDPRLAEPILNAERDGYLDAEDRVGKSPCFGFCSTFSLSRRQFICVNNAQTQEGVGTMAHEAIGHGNYAYHSRDQAIAYYRTNRDMECDEFAAMSQELLVPHHLNLLYKDPAELQRAERRMYEEFFNYIVKVAAADAFQHWVYAHPGSSQEERDQQWLKQSKRFSGIVDYTGYEDVRQNEWQERTHTINAPLYSEYLQAGVGALQLSALYDDPKTRRETMDKFFAFLKLGGSKSAAQAFETAGIQFDGTGFTLTASMEPMWRKLEKLRSKEEALTLEASRKDLGVLDHSRRAGLTLVPVPQLTIPIDQAKTA